MSDSIFTKIIKGEIPSHKIYEDENTFAFLDIHPKAPGHTLVVSKKQIDHIWDLPDEEYQALMLACRKIAQRMREVLKVSRVGAKVIGEEVPHAHVHLIPFNTVSEFNGPDQPTSSEEQAAMAKKLRFRN